MILLIDAGNTNIVFAICKDGEFISKWRIGTDGNRMHDEYASWLLPLFDNMGLSFSDISDCCVSSVVPNINNNIRKLIKDYFNLDAIFVKATDSYIGIDIDLDNPSELGSDRIIDALAVKKYYDFPALVIDFGTATTFNLIDKDGKYIGGAITAGVNLSLDALYMAAAKLPRIEIKKPKAAIGKNTVDAICSGAYFGYIAMIEGLIARFEKELGYNLDVYATGGLADIYSTNIDKIKAVDHELTIKGLLIAYENYKKEKFIEFKDRRAG